MKKSVFTCYDSKAGFHSQPFHCFSRGEAIRLFSDEANNPNTQLGKHPEDFTLFELGTFDDETAKFDLHATPISCGLASEFVIRGQAA